MITYTLSTPIVFGSLGSQTTVKQLQVTGLSYTSTPRLAPLGTGELEVTLTDPTSGFQEKIKYQDASVLALWQAPQSPAAGMTFGDIVAQAILAKLINDGKLPPGTITTS